ncbi:MAG TPA: hypothetical protein VFX25_18165 [Streptosporangiaceae bacterium]|nr:hypothetical protein [Streptosporangiaceae bacterium]
MLGAETDGASSAHDAPPAITSGGAMAVLSGLVVAGGRQDWEVVD